MYCLSKNLLLGKNISHHINESQVIITTFTVLTDWVLVSNITSQPIPCWILRPLQSNIFILLSSSQIFLFCFCPFLFCLYLFVMVHHTGAGDMWLCRVHQKGEKQKQKIKTEMYIVLCIYVLQAICVSMMFVYCHSVNDKHTSQGS